MTEYETFVNLADTRIDDDRQPQTQRERDKAKRIWAAYRWTWAMYWALGVKQGWKCGICGRTASNGALDGLNLDHEHFSIQSRRVDDPRANLIAMGLKWRAETTVQGRHLVKYAKTKVAAETALREDALPLSVRGLLCPGRHGKAGHGCCNRLLGRVDNPEWLLKAHNYVIDPPAKGLQI